MNTIYEKATVTVSDTVDGTKKRKAPQNRKPRPVVTKDFKVRPDVLATARKIKRVGETMWFLSESEVLLLPDHITLKSKKDKIN